MSRRRRESYPRRRITMLLHKTKRGDFDGCQTGIRYGCGGLFVYGLLFMVVFYTPAEYLPEYTTYYLMAPLLITFVIVVLLSLVELEIIKPLFGWLMSPTSPRDVLAFKNEEADSDQGRLKPKARQLSRYQNNLLIPLAINRDKKFGVTLANKGHTLVIGPTRSGKGLHLTQTLLNNDRAMVIIDPKGEQWKRTASYRQRNNRPVWMLPGASIDLAKIYNLQDSDDLIEFHRHLLGIQEIRADNRIFAEMSRFIFRACVKYATVHRLNPIRTIFDAVQHDAGAIHVLTELKKVAPADINQFLGGVPPEKYSENRLAVSVWSTLINALLPYQKHLETIAPILGQSRIVPLDYAERKHAIYITYSFGQLSGAGGLIAAILAGLMLLQERRPQPKRLTIAIDELPAIGLYNIEKYLSTMGGYRVYLLLYAQSFTQVEKLYGRETAQSILSNCRWQVWYRPQDMRTAYLMSDLYGTEFRDSPGFTRSQRGISDWFISQRSESVSFQQRPALEAAEIRAMPENEVLVQIDGRYRLRAERLWPVPGFPTLQRMSMPTQSQYHSTRLNVFPEAEDPEPKQPEPKQQEPRRRPRNFEG